MAIVYDWYENPNAEGESEERGLHPRPLLPHRKKREKQVVGITAAGAGGYSEVKKSEAAHRN